MTETDPSVPAAAAASATPASATPASATPASEPWPDPAPPAVRPRPAWGGALASLGIGVAAGLLALLPWLLTGARLPLQNLWAFETTPDRMPVAWLPLSQYSVTYLLGILVVGGAIAGIAARALRRRLPNAAPFSIAAGPLFVQIVAAAQSVDVLRRGLRDGGETAFYLAACIAVVVLGIAGGLLVFGLVARGRVPAAVIALTLAAIATGWWISGALVSLGPLSPMPYALAPLVTWTPPVLVGAAIAWGAGRSVGRIVATVASLVMLWVIPAIATAVQAGVGSRALLRSPGDLLDYIAQVFRSAVTMPQLVLPPLVVAIAVAAVGIGVRWAVARRAVARRR
ncbi:hypothetical protein H4J02_13315 [Protaetiibacter sp. SSC-01]|uniref:hypothetical protein n=1 Tax=Protaetiibacter sp. SSC-01 TaxID=2759943 RepID=UPI00165742C2|nr:hypothetical protein [Protaetiibacter sp. SSC-01]QNO37384.1 hypothetical protein H4J02_13315 [Protaetiibacter sp. SSC-01]